MIDPPTDAQIWFLASLKYRGEAPRSKAEAGLLIDGRKAGLDSDKLEKSMLRQRQKAQRDWFKQEREYSRMEIRQARDSAGAIAGFRIRVGRRCEKAKAYDGAFVPAQVAMKHPELFPPYDGICEYWACECEIQAVMESDRLAADTPMIIGPRRITTVGKSRSKRWPLVRLAILVLLVYLIYRMLIASN